MSFYEHFSEEALEILKARAERAATTLQNGHSEKPVTSLKIHLNKDTYALPIEALQAVYEGIKVVPVPCTPAFVAGIANVRGRIVPVLNLAILLQVSDAEFTGGSLIVVHNQTMTVAFMVEKIGDVTTFFLHDMIALPANSNIAHYLRGFLPDGSGLLDIHAILDNPELIVSEASL